MGQISTVNYQSKPIGKILQQIEKESDWVFNYDPSTLADFSFTGQLQGTQLESQLNQLFYHTPYTFEISNQTILVYLAPPKTYRLCGMIKDQVSQVPLALANIFADDLKQGTQTDEAGNFDFELELYKHQKITISYIGYKLQYFVIQEVKDVGCKDYFLEIDLQLFDEEIIITDYILPEISEGTTYSGVHIDYQKLAQRQTILEQDILKTVQLIPGITSIDESATNLQIRGGTPDQNLILWEDITLYDPGHLFGSISAINPYVIEEVQVFKGAFNPRYDNRVGGIVDLSLSDSLNRQFQGGFGSTFTEAHAYFSVPVIKDQLSITISGRNSINPIFNSPTLQNYSAKVFQGSKVEDQKEDVIEGDLDANQQLDFYDVNGKLIFQPTETITLQASWLKTRNKFNYQAEIFEDGFSTIDDVLFTSSALNLSSQIRLARDWNLNLSYIQSDYSNEFSSIFFDMEDDEIFYNSNIFNDILDRGFVLSLEHQLQPNLTLQFGYDNNYKAVNFNAEVVATFEEELEEINFTEANFHNAFGAFNYQQKNWQLNGGMRLTYYQEAQNVALSPRLNVQYVASDQLKLKLSGGIFQQYISQLKQFGENILDVNNQVWIINRGEGNDLQAAKKIAGGLVFQNKGWLIDLEGYYHYTDGLSTLGPSFGTSSASREIDDFSEGNSKTSGIDFLIKKNWRAYQTWLNYSFSKNNFFFPEIFDDPFPASNEQRHQLSLVNNYTHQNWNFTLSYQFKTGLPYTNGLEVGNDVDEEGETYAFVDYDDPNSQRLPNYSRLDAGISFRPTFKNSDLKAEFTLSLINLLNQSNIYRRDFFIDDVEDEDGEFVGLQLFGEDLRLLKRTPLLSMRVYW